MTEEVKSETPIEETKQEAAPVVETTDQVAAATTETAQELAPSARERLISRISGLLPEKVEDEDKYYEKAVEYIEQLEGETNKRKEADKKLLEVLRGEPELEGITKAVLKGVPVRAAIAKYFAPEELVPSEKEDDFDEYKKYAEERRRKVSEQSRFEQEVDENLGKSETALEEFRKANNLDDKVTTELVDEVSKLMNDLYRGILPKELLDHVYRSKTKDIEVSKAFEDGKINGKNQKIEEVMTSKKKTGDNIPTFNGGKTEEPEEKAPERKSRLDRLVEREQKKKFI